MINFSLKLDVKFIGELYLNRVIPQKVIHICVCSMFDKFQKEYFKAFAEQDTVSDDFEYNLEGIIKLYDQRFFYYFHNMSIKSIKI